MHEIGALYKMVLQAEKTAKANHVMRIKAMTVEVGELSGILPVFLEKYYSIVIENHPILQGSELNIKMIPGEGLCDECHALYNVAANEGACPKCGSRNKTILGGRDFVLKSILVEENTEV